MKEHFNLNMLAFRLHLIVKFSFKGLLQICFDFLFDLVILLEDFSLNYQEHLSKDFDFKMRM